MSEVMMFDGKIFSKEAILSTCYWCADRMISDVTEKDGSIVVSLNGRDGIAIDSKAVDEFKTMAVHNQLRYQLKEKFAAMEAAIIEKAFRPVARSE